jgi:DNA-binding NarL/FixJ family response regulator
MPEHIDDETALPAGAVRALVIGAHETSRLGAAVLLRREPWIGACVEAAAQGDAVRIAREQRPDVALLDISNLGPFAGFAVDALRAERPAMPIVLTSPCSAQARPPAGVEAAAFLPSTATGADIVAAVRAAVVRPDHDAADGAGAARIPGETALTPREREVLDLIAVGLTNREIGERLHLGPDAVKKHARSLYRKLGVRNRTEAAHHAARVAAVGANAPR